MKCLLVLLAAVVVCEAAMANNPNNAALCTGDNCERDEKTYAFWEFVSYDDIIIGKQAGFKRGEECAINVIPCKKDSICLPDDLKTCYDTYVLTPADQTKMLSACKGKCSATRDPGDECFLNAQCGSGVCNIDNNYPPDHPLGKCAERFSYADGDEEISYIGASLCKWGYVLKEKFPALKENTADRHCVKIEDVECLGGPGCGFIWNNFAGTANYIKAGYRYTLDQDSFSLTYSFYQQLFCKANYSSDAKNCIYLGKDCAKQFNKLMDVRSDKEHSYCTNLDVFETADANYVVKRSKWQKSEDKARKEMEYCIDEANWDDGNPCPKAAATRLLPAVAVVLAALALLFH